MTENSFSLVAHRGYPERYPENSLTGIEAALKTGAKAIEFDIQLSSDGIPMVFHDETLLRVTGTHGKIWQTPFKELKQLSALEPERFQNQFETTKVCSLAEVCELLTDYPKVEVFVEIKQESLTVAGIEAVINNVLNTIKPIAEQCIITSFNSIALEYTQTTGFERIAWVIKQYNKESESTATQLQPDFLLCNYLKLPKTQQPLWPGNWNWMLYTINDAQLAFELAAMGANYIETDDIGAMLLQSTKTI